MGGFKHILTDARCYDLLNHQAEVNSSAPAWIERAGNKKQFLSWRQLSGLVSSMAHWLEAHGVTAQSLVVQWAPNSLEWVLIDLACSAINAIHAPLDPRMPLSSVEDLCKALAPSLCLASPERAKGLGFVPIPHWHELPKELQLFRGHPFQTEDASLILFTSGTTNQPRGVVLSHSNLISNAMAKLDAMPQYCSDHRLNLLTFAHAYARTCELTAWLLSGCCLETVSSIDELFNCLPRSQPTLLNAVPAVYQQLAERWQDLGGDPPQLHSLLGGRIRQLASGGAPLSASLRSSFAQAGIPIYQGYGLTEAGPVVCSNRSPSGSIPPILDGVGPPIRNTEVRLNESKTLFVRGPGVMKRYWQDREATHRHIRDSWLDTGDIAESNRNGSFVILGRTDDILILSTGYKIMPQLVEKSVEELDPIEECILVGQGQRYAKLLLRSPLKNIPIDYVIGHLLRQHPNTLRHLEGFYIVGSDWPEGLELTNFKGGKRRSAFETNLARITQYLTLHRFF